MSNKQIHELEWPLPIYVCQECARPSLFKEDRCCLGYYTTVYVRPADDVPEETDWLIEELNIGVRPYNVLKHAGITTIGQLIDRTEREIRWLPGMGKTSMTDLKREMSERNLQFKAKR